MTFKKSEKLNIGKNAEDVMAKSAEKRMSQMSYAIAGLTE